MSATETPLHQGEVTCIRGVVRAAGQTLRSKLHGAPCVYWDVRVGLADEPEATDVCAFWLEDPSGERFLVRGEGLDVDVRAQRAEALVQVVEEDIAVVSATIRELKDVSRTGPIAKQGEAHRERRRLAKVATLLCAIRAEARGNVHVGGNLEGQRAWIAKNASLATGVGGRSLERRQERFEVVLREGDAVEVEGQLRREPLPSGLGGGYRERTDCWAVGPGPSGHVRVLGVGATAPVSEREVRGEAAASSTRKPGRSAAMLGDLDPVLVVTLLVSGVAIAVALAYAAP